MTLTAARLGLGAFLVAASILALGNPVAFLACVAYGSMGYLLVARRPRNLIGWLLILVAAGSAIAAASLDTWAADLAQGTALGWVPFLVLLQRLCSAVGITAAFALLATVYPTGRWPRGGVGRLSLVGFALIGLIALLQVLAPTLRIESGGSEAGTILVANPIGIAPGWPGWSVLETGGGADLVGDLGLALCILGFIVRFGRATGTERLQDKWLVGSLAFLAVAIVWGAVLVFVAGPDAAATMDPATLVFASAIAWGPATIALPLPPIAIAIAITRYRLFDIDRIISRTVSYAVVTGILGAVFAAVVLGLQAVLAPIVGGQTLPIAGSTLVVAALFQPLRHRVQAIVDRRFDRARVDGELVVAALSERLRDEVELSNVRQEVLLSIGRALHPAGAGVWLRGRPQ